jgi:hypothetical protein
MTSAEYGGKGVDVPEERAAGLTVTHQIAGSLFSVNDVMKNQGGDQRNVNQEVVNQVDVNQLNPTQRSLFLLINQLNIITILSWLRWQG